jgi:hypothetical protein
MTGTLGEMFKGQIMKRLAKGELKGNYRIWQLFEILKMHKKEKKTRLFGK